MFQLILSAAFCLPVWLVATVVNVTIGVVSAGYTVAQALPILGVTFGVLALIGLLVEVVARFRTSC